MRWEQVMKSSTGSGDEFGGGMDDLFEGGVEHDAMEEADAVCFPPPLHRHAHSKLRTRTVIGPYSMASLRSVGPT